ncbi:histidine acid phosphatase [Phlyctema vagabunda]|uniref:3-phytase n=1 Tax=Phlyctema vagabunda TaxID=108571 RepID=A0ABR4PQK4_9HELO
MPSISKQVLTAASFLLATQTSATVYLAPEQDVNLPSSGAASNPLTSLGANGPYFTGPNVNGVSRDIPEGCKVDQVAYVTRHGSRFPDTGAYNEWVALYEKIGNATFEAQGSLAFLRDWKPVLTNPKAQIAQESITGYKEAYDMGYTLRTRYPDLYQYGTPFISWANLYPRVVQTAQNFVRGFLGHLAGSLGTVVAVNSTGSPDAFFDSLAPSDLCPAFSDEQGGNYTTTWDSIYLPPITARLNALLTGDLNLTTSDVSIFPYLCGFESQITGVLSPFCGVFTDDELERYEYRQTLRYYYGTGPGTGLPSAVMLPFLNSLVDILSRGPGISGTTFNGTTFELPRIITAFLNDGQLTELGAGTGVWDDQKSLPATYIPSDRKYKASNFVTMRGTVALERMVCEGPSNSTSSHFSNSTSPAGDNTFVRILLNDAVYPLPSCKSGPGSSCLLSAYATYVADKLEGKGSFYNNCNVTNPAISSSGVKGASFFTDLGSSWLSSVAP